MPRLEGKVAIITGGARGQGRSHAIRLAEEGADIVVCDIADQIENVVYPMSTRADLDETVELVEKLDRRCVAVQADVRDAAQVRGVVETAVDTFGKVDILAANAGIALTANWDDEDESLFQDTMDVNVKGVWLACREVAKHLIARNAGGSLILTSSVAGIAPIYTMHHYNISKHGVIGMMRTLSAELAPHHIRVNCVVPGVVRTPMMLNEPIQDMFAGKSGASADEMWAVAETLNLLPNKCVEPVDISNAVLWLASDEARYVTGVALPVDNGQANQPSGVPRTYLDQLAAGNG
jgi:(+)-trans-carveol dehydrogenase